MLTKLNLIEFLRKKISRLIIFPSFKILLSYILISEGKCGMGAKGEGKNDDNFAFAN